ncbi:MAG: acyl-CoA dehydratase activase-related protein [Termitinemataceae bacterium]|nr:MAG: acyl-CoA dehydratase activase-related protein [Termitinemataceae bacterium]
MTELHLGIDVGSTTVKAVVMDSSKEVLFSKYERHNAMQSETVLSFLNEIFSRFPTEVFKAAVCGSGGRVIAEMLDAPYVQEVVANSIAIRTFYPQTRVAIELGGQDAKIVFFYFDKTTGRLASSDMRMNGSCAGGTGAFIDEVATLLQVQSDKFEALAAKGSQVYDISGRCGVFAKTDIQPLLNQGCLREDIALSTFHAITKQTIGGLAQGLELKPPIIFEGGPLTFNPTLVRVFAERLNLQEGDIIIPKSPETIVAYGAALAVNDLFKDEQVTLDREKSLASLADFRARIARGDSSSKQLKYFENDEELAAFKKSHALAAPPVCNARRGDTLRAYLGIDGGSTTTKFVLLDEDENVVDSFYSSNKGQPLVVVQKALLDLKKKYDDAGINLEIIALGTTGYAELLFDKALGADYHTVETVAHSTAAQKYIPGVTFILDIGGQDMKAINIADGIVTNITVNEACSSGCGSFLENFAANLHIPLDEIADAAFSAVNPAVLGSRCTVFMNSTIITEQKNGKQANDIMAVLCRSIIENVFTKVVRLKNINELGDKIVVQGGTFNNDAVLRAMEQYLGREIVRAPYTGIMGAIGIALLTKREISENGYTSPHGTKDKSRFIGFDALQNFSYTQENNMRCPFCMNNCNRTLVTFSNGVTWVTGNRCERGEIVGDPTDPKIKEQAKKLTRQMDCVPDMVREREKLCFKDYSFTPLCEDRGITIGIPRVLDFWRSMPFWTTFFHALGFKTKISPVSSRKIFESGLQFVASDTVCFPAKLVHGHIRSLADNGEGQTSTEVDRIFFPIFANLPSDNGVALSTYTCPVLKGYPIVVRSSDNPQERWKVPFDIPIFHWFKYRDRNIQLCKYAKDTFGIPKSITQKAIVQADNALNDFNHTITVMAKKIIAETEAQGKFAVVLAGRHYQFDELVNHKLSRYFTGIGIPVITVDALTGIQEKDLSKSMLDVNNNNHGHLLSGAIIAAENPALEYVQVFSFGCGHDAIYTDEVTRILNTISNKSPLVLKLDESDVSGPLRIRVRSFIETVQLRRRKQKELAISKLDDPYPVKFLKEDIKTKTVLIPNVSHPFCQMITAAFRLEGIKAYPMPLGGAEAMRLGKKYVHNDICFPAQIVIGEALETLQSGKFDLDKVVVGTGKTVCDCRLVNYMALTRKALDAAGFENVPIMSTDFNDVKNMHPAFRMNKLTYVRITWCMIMMDILDNLRRKIHPYELNKGQANKMFYQAIDDIATALETSGMSASFEVYKKAINDFCDIPYNRTNPKQLVFITGEYLLTFHEGSNFHVEEYLEEHGMEVELPLMYDVYRNLMVLHIVSEIKDFHVRHSLNDILYGFGGDKFFEVALDITEKVAAKHPLFKKSLRLPEAAKLSDHIIHHSIQSGEGFMMAADIIHRAREGVKSFIILQPFGCLPNHFCGRGIIKRLKEEFPAIQILPLDYDPDTSFANIENRLQMLIMNAKSCQKHNTETI